VGFEDVTAGKERGITEEDAKKAESQAKKEDKAKTGKQKEGGK
jgi:hypothetical protein